MRLPGEFREAALAFFGLTRAYLRLASAARAGRVDDHERRQIESETLEALPMAAMVEERINDLPEMQRKVLALYYFEDLRLREIAEAFGVTESRICQIHGQAILAIKSLLQKEDPDVFNHPLRTDA